MALRRLDLRGVASDRRTLTELLPRPVDEQDRSSEAVAGIIAEVRAGGDDALRACTARYDRVDIDDLRVPAEKAASLIAQLTRTKILEEQVDGEQLCYRLAIPLLHRRLLAQNLHLRHFRR